MPPCYLLLIMTSFFWGGNFVAGKFMIDHGSALTLTMLRWGVALLILIPLVWMRERRLLPPKKALLSLMLMGATGVALFNIFIFLSVKWTTAYNAGLLSALNPVAIAVCSYFLLKEKVNARQTAGMLVSLIGVGIVVSGGRLQALLELELNLGDLLMLAAVVVWGLYSVAGRQAMKVCSPYMSTMWAGIFGMLFMLPFIPAWHAVRSPDAAFWLAAVYVSIGSTVLAMIFWNIGVQKLGGTRSGMFLNLNPLFTALLAFFFLGERLTLAQGIGTIFVIGGVYWFMKSALATDERMPRARPSVKRV